MTFPELGQRSRLALLGLAALSAAILAQLAPIQSLDDRAQDVLIRATPSVAPSPSVALVDVDERSLQEIGPWPWPRPVLAELMARIDASGAQGQAWDLFLPEPASGDVRLREVMAQTRFPVVLGQVLVTDPAVQPAPRVGALLPMASSLELCSSLPVLGHLGIAPSLVSQAPRMGMGHLTATPDADGRLRRLPAILCASNQTYPQLVLAFGQMLLPDPTMAQSSPGRWPLGPNHWLTLGALRFPLNEDAQLSIPFRRSHREWPAISAAEILADPSAAAALKGRLVLVGSSALGVGDSLASPFHPNAPGLSVHAELLDAALTGGWVLPVQSPSLVSAFLAVLAALFLLPLHGRLRGTAGLGLGVLAVLMLPWLISYMIRPFGIALPVVAPLGGLVVGGLLLMLAQLELQRRQTVRLSQHLQSFLPAPLAMEIARQDPSGESLGRPGEGVVIALQLRGLERWTTTVDSLKALAFVHGVWTTVDALAKRHGGALEHRQADSLLLVFPGAEPAPMQPIVEALALAIKPLVESNESVAAPLGLQFSLELGPYLLAVAGGAQSRRPLLLGPAVDSVLAQAALGPDLAVPAVVGPALAAQQRRQGAEGLVDLGHFLLLDQPEAKPLFGMALPAHCLAHPDGVDGPPVTQIVTAE